MRQPVSVRAALAEAVALLAPSSPSPRLDAEALLAHAAKLNRSALIAHGDRPLDASALADFRALVARRARGEPVAYLVGRREFWALELEVTPATLIPRPETELLVERALQHLAPGREALVADLATGSGAVALAVAHERPRVRVVATDRSASALAVARRNAARLGIANVEFREGDWFAPLETLRFDLIVSNPPYVALGDPHLGEGDLRFEPVDALVAGPDGLEAIRHIARHARQHLLPGGRLILEHGYDQAHAVRALLHECGYRGVTSHRDLSDVERVTEGSGAERALLSNDNCY